MAIKKTRYEKVNTADVAVTVISSILITTVATTIIMGLGPTLPCSSTPTKKKKKNQLAQFSRTCCRHKNRKQKGAPASEKVCVFFFFRKHSYTCTKLFDLHNEWRRQAQAGEKSFCENSLQTQMKLGCNCLPHKFTANKCEMCEFTVDSSIYNEMVMNSK